MLSPYTIQVILAALQITPTKDQTRRLTVAYKQFNPSICLLIMLTNANVLQQWY